jgi:hypothetical protein
MVAAQPAIPFFCHDWAESGHLDVDSMRLFGPVSSSGLHRRAKMELKNPAQNTAPPLRAMGRLVAGALAAGLLSALVLASAVMAMALIA